jgi:hypothetical protein
MNVWEKLVNDPELGKPNRSPLACAVIGLGLSVLDMAALRTGAFQFGKYNNVEYLRFSDHPALFLMLLASLAAGAAWAFRTAHKRYLMHGD